MDKLENRLKQIVKEVCEEREAELMEIECDKDHVHILVEVDPQYGIHKLINKLKDEVQKFLEKNFLF